MNFFFLSSAVGRGFGALALGLSTLTTLFPASARAETFVGDATRFSPDVGQPIFPAGNLSVFKQYVLAFDVSERVGDTVEIDLLFTSIEFGGELAGGTNAAIGLEMGLCFGGNADFDLGFKPTVTVPDRYPTEFPIQLTVAEGLMPDSHFTTSFPPLGKAYADLIFELGAYLKASACVFGCFDAIDFDFSTCDLPPIGGYPMFQKSTRCDPTLNEIAYCAVELASFNRNDDNAFRMLNVTAKNRFEFLAKPYNEYSLGSGTGARKPFTADPTGDKIRISGVHRFTDGSQVTVSSTGSLPGGLNSSTTYYVNHLAASGPTGIEFELARRKGGSAINLTSAGSGSMEIKLTETSKPSEPSIGKYGTISISVPTVGTDSRTSSIDSAEKSFTVDPSSDRVIITSPPGLRLGNKVRVSSVGELPDGLNPNCVYYVADAASNGLSLQLSTVLGGPVVDIQSFGVGTHRLSLQAEFNTVGGLKSSGAEDIMAIGVDVATLVGDLILPPSFPSLSDSGSVGPIGWHYTIASFELGPAVQLQTDFELTWDLRVTEIIFRKPGTVVPQAVRIDNQSVTALSQVTPARTVYLKNAGANALPSIVLPTTDPVEVTIAYTLEPKLKTVVSTPFLGRVKYAALGAGASIDRIGELNIGPLIHGEHNFKAGEFTVYDGAPSPIASAGPRDEFAELQDLSRYQLRLVDTTKESVPAMGCAEVYLYKLNSVLYLRIFDITGEEIADEPAQNRLPAAMLAELLDLLDPWPISSLTDNEKENILKNATALSGFAPGKITFQLQAAGPPSYFWRPSQLGFTMPSWTDKIIGPITNWLEVISLPNSMASYPGEFGIGSDATIDQSPFPSLYADIQIASLKVTSGRRLDIMQTHGLTVWGGVVENNGTINLWGDNASEPAYLRLGQPETMLTGNGNLRLNQNSALLGPAGAGHLSFTNYNTIYGSGEAMNLYTNYADSTFVNHGNVYADGPTSGHYLITSAHHFINEGGIGANTNGGLSMKGLKLENRPDSYVFSAGANANSYFTFNEVDHAGLLYASSGGYLSISTRNFPRTIWNSGLSFNDEVGQFYASGLDSRLDFNATDVIGGLLRAVSRGSIFATNSTFSGSDIVIGTFNSTQIDPTSGSLALYGSDNRFTKVSLTNWGTITVYGTAEFADDVVFANNGTIVVPVGGVLRIREVTPDLSDPNASEVAKAFPGTANATEEMLVGGTWDISGVLEIEGAHFTGTAANAARSVTSYGSVDDQQTRSVEVEDALSQVLSLGAPAHVILRTPAWSFPSLERLTSNDGTIELRGGADYPSGSSSRRTEGDFENRGHLVIDASSDFKIGGSFLQTGAHASTTILTQGELTSGTNDFQILGGTVTVANDADFMNRYFNTFDPGTTITLSSPIIDTNQVDAFGRPILDHEIVRLEFGSDVQISTIDFGVSITLNGDSVQFPALMGHLIRNDGAFTLSGEGLDNRGSLKLAGFSGETFTNTGELNLLGLSTEFSTANYVQSGTNARTLVGAGATLVVFTSLQLDGGELVMEIGSRPSVNDYATLRGSNFAFNNRLTIDFTGRLAESMPDVGDTWELISSKLSAPISGVTNVAFRLEGASLPGGWLPANTHLEMVQFQTSFGPRGLGVRVVPDAGFISYDAWAASHGLNRALASTDPMRDANNDGVINALEYLFGNNDGDGTFPGQQEQGLVQANGQTYYEMHYIRPTGVDAVYTPYYSADLEHWYAASMAILSIADTGTGQGLEWVTLRSTFPVPDQAIFFRVKGTLNTESFDIGLLPEDPINWGSGLRNFEQTLRESLGEDVAYHIAPGKTLYFNVNANVANGTAYGGTAPNGVTRNFIYQDRSALQTAVVHAGLLTNGQRGIIKVTFVDPQQTAFIGSTQNPNSPSQVTSGNASSDPQSTYSYMVELEEAF